MPVYLVRVKLWKYVFKTRANGTGGALDIAVDFYRPGWSIPWEAKKVTDIKFEQNLFPLETAKKTGQFFHNLCSTRFKMKLTTEIYLTGNNTHFTTTFCLLVTFRDQWLDGLNNKRKIFPEM